MEFCKLNMIFAPGLQIKLLFADKKDQKMKHFFVKDVCRDTSGRVNKKSCPETGTAFRIFI